MMMLSVAFLCSFNLTLLTLISEIITPYGYTDNDAAVFGFWINFIGNFGGLLASLIIDKTGHYKRITIAVILMTILISISFQLQVIYIPKEAGYWGVFITLILLGFVNNSIYSFCL
jgi:MFS family permease